MVAVNVDLMTSDLSAQSLLQFTQLILLLQQRQSLVETLRDLQRYTVTGFKDMHIK